MTEPSDSNFDDRIDDVNWSPLFDVTYTWGDSRCQHGIQQTRMEQLSGITTLLWPNFMGVISTDPPISELICIRDVKN
jgi:hypothetical protein